MNIKSLLLGSAAALAAVSGAQAADAIVAAEPEPMEYVRVCDAFGTGYFYIPGTETCLSISGYVRTQLNYDQDIDVYDPVTGGLLGTGIKEDWDSFTRGYLTFAAKNDTEFGTLSSYINIQADTDGSGVSLDGAWIEIAGFKVGYFYNWWDDFGLAGETDETGGNLFNSIQYTYDAGSFQVGASVEDLDVDGAPPSDRNDDIGVSGLIRATVGGVDALLIASYDFDVEEAAFKARLTAELGPGTFGIAGIYATDPNAYWAASEWSVVASYEIKATDKFTITPAAQYFGDYAFGDGNDAWKVGLTAGYQITEGLRTLATVNYTSWDQTAAAEAAGADDDRITGFLRLQRDF